MTTEVLSFPLAANATATAGQGTTFYVKSATAPVTILAETIGTGGRIRKFTNIPAGFKFTAAPNADGSPSGFTYLRVQNGATAQTIELIVGDDDVSLSNAVSVTGAVSTVSTPITNVQGLADQVVATANKYSIPANLSRRAISVGSLSTNSGSVRLQGPGQGAGFGTELQPGQFISIGTTAAMDVRNDSGAAQTITLLEES